MTRIDRDVLRGWQAAQKGFAMDPSETPEWQDGYRMWLRSRGGR